MTVAEALEATLTTLNLDSRDEAAMSLARSYARLIDQDGPTDLGPKLLAVLTALGATPAARNAVKGTADDHERPNPLAAIREARRQLGAPDLHPAFEGTDA